MAIGKGYKVIAGAKKEATFNTPILVAANNGFEFRNEGLTPDSQFIPDEQIGGKATRLFGSKGNEFHAGPIEIDYKYEGLELFLAMGQGLAGAPTQVGTDNAYKHVFKISDDPAGLFLTLVFDKQVKVWEYVSCKVEGWTFSIKQGERAKLKVDLIPHALNRNAGTGTNNSTTIAGITLPANRDFATFSQLAVRLNAQAAGALAGADLVYLSEMEVSGKRNFAADDVTTRFGFLPDEPTPDSWFEVKGSMKFSKYETANEALFDALMDKSRKKMDLKLTGPAIGATFFQYNMYFPDLQFETGDANVGGPERIPLNVDFMANRVLTIPTGFPTGYTDAATVELVNQKNTDALA